MSRTIVIAIPVLLIGGTEIQTLHLLRVLSGTGYVVTVCCYYEYDTSMVKRYEEAGAKVLLMKYERAAGLWHLFRGLVRLFGIIKPDIVHVQYLAPGLVPVIAARAAGIRTIFATVHQPGTAYGLKEKILIRFACSLSTAFFCVSRAVERTWFADRMTFEPDNNSVKRRHFVIYNSIDTETIDEVVNSTDKQALRREHNLIGFRTIGFVGRLRNEKGLDILIEAMSELLKLQSDIALVVVGDGPDREELEQKAANCQIDRNIRWLGQKLSADVYRLYCIMDVVVVPSLFEGFGLSAAEAMAAGIPVVGTACGGLTEVIEDGKTGFLVSPGESKAITAALVRLLNDTDIAQTMGHEGKTSIQREFSMNKFKQAVLAAYRLYA